MWLAVSYQPTSLFSLKLSSATNSAGKSLPVPSPYAVKMALLNAIITSIRKNKMRKKKLLKR